jgi:large subunit ribosomal protein L24
MSGPYRVKCGTEVVVISGAHKGKRGKLLKIDRSKGRVLVEGVGLRKKYLRKSQSNPEGSVVERETPIAYSNILTVEAIDRRRQKRENRAANRKGLEV